VALQLLQLSHRRVCLDLSLFSVRTLLLLLRRPSWVGLVCQIRKLVLRREYRLSSVRQSDALSRSPWCISRLLHRFGSLFLLLPRCSRSSSENHKVEKGLCANRLLRQSHRCWSQDESSFHAQIQWRCCKSSRCTPQAMTTFLSELELAFRRSWSLRPRRLQLSDSLHWLFSLSRMSTSGYLLWPARTWRCSWCTDPSFCMPLIP